MQMTPLKRGPDRLVAMSLATMVKKVAFDPEQEEILKRAFQPEFAGVQSIQIVLKLLGRALENYLYWDSILIREIWPQRRYPWRMTSRQKATADDIEAYKMASWEIVTVHLGTLDALTAV